MLSTLIEKSKPSITPVLDPEFRPPVLWNKAFREAAEATGNAQPLIINVKRNNGASNSVKTVIFPHTEEYAEANIKYVERLVKFLIWAYGGQKITIAGCDAIANEIARQYSADGERAFDNDLIGLKVYGKDLEIISCSIEDAPADEEYTVHLGRNMDGVRIGFDLGGSDRKAATMVDGKVVYSEEIKWDPYFQEDFQYHLDGVRDTLNKAIAAIPEGRKLDAIGGSAAGVYVDNLVRSASLFRGVTQANGGQVPEQVINIFEMLKEEYGVPFICINDGEVTALAGSMEMNANSVLGISMGTSVAGGYVTPKGTITDWVNELAFVPCDYREDGPVDEWSGDAGCCVQYFCQQGVARLAKRAGINFPADMKFPEQLEEVQKMMIDGDEKASQIYETLGVEFGYTIAYFAEFYDIRNLLILGRVTSGKGGDMILEIAHDVLKKEFPTLAAQIEFRTPDEKNKRHGQAVAAASLPELAK